MAKKKRKKSSGKQARIAHSRSQLKKEAFLKAYAECGNVSAACLAADISRRAHYGWLEKDANYARAFDDAQEIAIDLLELEARRRALNGVDEPVIWQGQLMGQEVKLDDSPETKFIPLTVKKYSDTLLIFLLKGHKPQKYRENHRVEHTGKAGGPIVVVERLDANAAFYASKQQRDSD